MSVTITKTPDITVNVSLTIPLTKLESLGGGTIFADGTEQTIVEYVKVGRVIGYIDLSNMTTGDTIVIRQYMKLKTGGEYKKYAEETYSGTQSIPIIYITPKETDYGVKITIQQTAGTYKSFDYNFLKEGE
jgi:hypothetical protein